MRTVQGNIEICDWEKRRLERVEIMAVLKVECPTCKSPPRQTCFYIALGTHLGQVLLRPHSPRLKLLTETENGL